MSDDPILTKLTELFRNIFDDEEIVITRASTAEDVDGWDSVNHITLVVAVEQAFGIKFRTAEIESLGNVGDLAALIAAKTGG